VQFKDQFWREVIASFSEMNGDDAVVLTTVFHSVVDSVVLLELSEDIQISIYNACLTAVREMNTKSPAFDVMGFMLSIFSDEVIGKLDNQLFMEAVRHSLDGITVSRYILQGLQALARNGVAVIGGRLNHEFLIPWLAQGDTAVSSELLRLYSIVLGLEDEGLHHVAAAIVLKVEGVKVICTGLIERLTARTVRPWTLEVLAAFAREFVRHREEFSRFFELFFAVCVDIIGDLGHPCREVAEQAITELP
jgi:hypothetical protein